ncbi:MAG: hypothetical protein AAB530_00800 [Patescibacteria group bacterium]
MKKVLKIIKKTILIILLIILVLYIGLVIYRIPAAFERYDTKKTVDDIHNQKLKMEDVMRKDLPPEPDEKLNNSTLNGIDTNNNSIRDDVEIAIFKLYPDSARIRSGALQYAKAMQMHFRKDIINSETFVAVLQEDSRGFYCFSRTFLSKITKEMNKESEEERAIREKETKFPKNSFEYNEYVWGGEITKKINKISSEEFEEEENRRKVIQDLVFNNEARKNKKESNYEKYMTSYGDLRGNNCDIDP